MEPEVEAKMFSEQPQSLGHSDQCWEASQLCVVPDTSSKLVAPAAEVVVHAPPMEVRPTGGTGL